MTDRKYIGIDEMKEKVAEQDQQRKEEFHAFLNGLADDNMKKQKELQSLAAKAIQSDQEDAKKKRTAEIEAEKEKAIAAIEAKYESQGVKSDETLSKEQAWKNVLGGLRRMKD